MDQPNSNLSGNIGPTGPGGDDFPVIEGYDVIDLIGRGGMGAVYEALQQSTGRRVAVKLMLERAGATEAARRRFEREVELIARLTHPGIVSVLDSGLHKSRYFYVMEHVDGKPLDEAMPPGVCSVREALRAIAKVARAVEYAHQRGVMHRDLKPSNILVDDRGEPRLLDFGLAKAFDPNSLINVRDSLSEPGQVIGTLGYMSPEQARGAVAEVSVRADVYALGAIAYELVTGSLPCAIDGPMAIVFHRIESRDPDRPSAIRKEIDADVDAVLLKALEKSPTKRYATAAEFADDLEHWLEGTPVKARRISSLHRGVRWCKRNPAVAGVFVTLVFLAGAIGATALFRAQRERAIAQRDLFDSGLMLSVGSLDPDKGPGLADVARPQLIRIEESLVTTPRLAAGEAQWREQIGEQWRKWGNLSGALASATRALELQQSLHDGPHEDVARCLRNLGGAHYDLGQYTEAAALCRQSLDMRIQLSETPERIADSKNYLAQTLGKLRRFEEAERLQQEVIDTLRRALGPGAEKSVASINNFATLRKDQGDFAGAERRYREAMEAFIKGRERKEEDKPRQHRHVATSLRNIANCMMEQGKFEGVEPLLIDAQSIASEVLGKDHPAVASARHDLARLRLEQNRSDEAESLAREALSIREAKRGEDHSETIATRLLLGRILTAAGQPAAGEKPLRRALDQRRAATPLMEIDVAEAKAALGECLLAQDRVAEALPWLREAWPVLERELGLDQRRTRACAQLLARALESSGDKASATALRDRVGMN